MTHYPSPTDTPAQHTYTSSTHSYNAGSYDAAESALALEETLTRINEQTAAHHDDDATQAPMHGTQAPLRTHVEQVVRAYFAALGDELPTDLYALILKEVEAPLLQVVLEQTRGNQSKCAKVLGLNRGTLRKKLKMYDLMD